MKPDQQIEGGAWEALERIANGDIHESWCGEGCDHAEELARAVLHGADPLTWEPRRPPDNGMRIALSQPQGDK